MVGASLGNMKRVDQNALKRKEEEQRIKVVFDVRRRIRVWKVFEFSPVVKPELTFIFEKVKGFCRDCGVFVHDATGCDKLLIREKEDIQAGLTAGAMAGLSLTSGLETGSFVRDKSLSLSNVDLEVGSGSVGQGAVVVAGEKGDHVKSKSVEFMPSILSGIPRGLEPVIHTMGNLKLRVPMLVAPLEIDSQSATLFPKLSATGNEGSRMEFSSMQLVPTGRKRKAALSVDRLRKKYLTFPESKLEVKESVPLIVQHKNGMLLVSPKKKKGGRPKGSKNKIKNADEQEVKKIRKYKRRGKILNFDSSRETLDPSTVEELGTMQIGEEEVVKELPVLEGSMEGAVSPSRTNLI